MVLGITYSARSVFCGDVSRLIAGLLFAVVAAGAVFIAVYELQCVSHFGWHGVDETSMHSKRLWKTESERRVMVASVTPVRRRGRGFESEAATVRFRGIGVTRGFEIDRVSAKGAALEAITQYPRTRVLPEEIEGLKQLIEDPGGRALAPFYRDLLRTAEGKPGAVTRVSHYGDSAVAYDHIASTLRRRLQQRFGDAGHGFVLISRGHMHYRHRNIRHRASASWRLFTLVRNSLGLDWYGYGGVQYQSEPGSSAHFETAKKGAVGRHVSRFEIFYQKYRRGGNIKIRVDGKKWGALNTRSEIRKDAWEVIDLPDGPHSLTIRGGHGVARLYGVALERTVPGVVYDSLGMVGGQANRLLNAEPEHMKRQISHRDPSLIILGFGGNEACNAWLNLENYERDLHRVIRMMRGENRYPCLLFGPLDQGEYDKRGRVQTIKKVQQVIAVQRRVALSQQCAYFDTFSAMGGERSIWHWYRQKPPLATADFKHATPAGYEVIGEMFYKALLKEFADFLKQNR